MRSRPAQLRPAVPADARALARLRYTFRAALGTVAESEAAFLPRCEAWMAERLARSASWRCWVAIDEGRVCGMIWLFPLEKIPNPVDEPERHGYISSLYVTPEHRGRGLGSDLLTECLRACDAEGFDAIFLWPTPLSRSLYARHGFVARDDLLERRRSDGAASGAN
jgi:ribosomal protein S18 acetylase RimI-like enzyme